MRTVTTYDEVMERIDWWVETENIPRDFLLKVAEKAESQAVDWGQFEAKTFNHKYYDDDCHLADVIYDKIEEEANWYCENREYEREKEEERK